MITAVNIKHLYERSVARWSEAAGYLSEISLESEDRTLFYMCENNDIVLCEKRFATVQAAVATLKSFKKSAKRRPKRIVSCACPYCEKPFPSADMLNEHLKKGSTSVCPECGVIAHRSQIPRHLLDKHRVETMHCGICHELFDSSGAADWHMARCHGARSVTCQICGRGYRSERGLRAHRYSHTLFCCSDCGRSFENNRCHRHHRRVCTAQRKRDFTSYECDDCGAKYDKKPSLKIHIVQKHLNVLPYICHACGKRTSTRAHLKSHERVHDAARKVLACHCGARFRTELGYRLHLRAHSGLKPYKCEHCEETFLSSSRRLDHEKRRHKASTELAHGCGECPARFIRPWELRKHRAMHHAKP